MFKRRPKSKPSFLVFSSSNRGSDIVKPENTSLIVNDSDSDADELPKALTSILSESEEENEISVRKSSSLMNSLTLRTQSTPKKQSSPKRVLKEINGKSPTLSRKKSQTVKNISQNERKKLSYFEEVLQACGASALPGNSSYLLSVDQAVFSMKVNKKLNGQSEDLKKFIQSLEKEMDNNYTFQKMLAHTLTSEDCSVARGPVQEPIIRLLLNVDCLQADILNLLIKKLASIFIENKVDDSQLVSSILRQMRFLNRVTEMTIASDLFEIIQIASVNIQREIIFFLPEIIIEKETEQTCAQLIDLLKLDVKLTHVIIDALTNLPLNKEIQCQVRGKVMNRLDKSPLEFLPSLVQFVLNRCDVEELNEVISGLRANLPFTLQHHEIRKAAAGANRNASKVKSNTDEDSYTKLTFENLKFSVMASKSMAEMWIKIISNINSPEEFRCVDFIMLIAFYSCLFGRKNQILTLIRNKIKSGVLDGSHVEETFKILLVMTAEYFPTILELASILLKSFETKIADFGALLYKECFVHFNFYMEQTVISEILLHIGTGSPGVIDTALNILKELSETQKESLCGHTMSIMGLLIKISDLDLNQVRILMDVISSLVFSDFAKDNGGWQDELQIFIRKQLVSSKLDQCKKGVVAAIMMGKHAGKREESGDFQYSQINALLEMAMGSSGTSDIKKSFFNDEFATMFKESKLNEKFLRSWNDKIYRFVMDNLFVKDIQIECEDFPMFLQYSLEERDNHKLVFPVVVFIINTHATKPLNIPVPVIPSALRLLWCLEPNFERILPVYYASVIMPEKIVYESFNDFNENQKKKILDCLFLCSNFLVECINALCSHGIVDKALLRVKQLIKIRKLISGHIDNLPDYVPHLCQFYVPVQKIVMKKKVEKKPKKGRKRKIDEASAESSIHPLEDSQAPGPSTSYCSIPAMVQEEQQKADQNSDERDLRVYAGYFRELNIEAHKLLEADFSLESIDSLGECSQKVELETSDVLFLLEDFLYKSEQILKDSRRSVNLKAKTTVFMERIKPEDFIVASVKIMPNIVTKIEMFSKYCQDLLKANDGIYDAKGMFLPESSDVKLAFAASLKFLSEIVSWKGFQLSTNKPLLRDLLMILSDKTNSRENYSTLPSVATVAVDAAVYLAGYSKNIPILAGVLSMIKAFQACLSYSPSKRLSNLADLCRDALTRRWYTAWGACEKGSVYNQDVDFLLKTYFAFVDNKLEVVCDSAKTSLEEVEQLSGKEAVMATFKTISKSNFPLLYRTICEALVSASNEEFSRLKNDDQKALEVWSRIIEVLLVLVDIAKIHSSRVVLASLLKRSQSIIQLFLNKGLPLVESALRIKSVEVLSLLKSLQTVTRFLHSICCQSKITNDSIVAAHVPIIRSLCERLTLEVKGVLIVNKIPMECITIAILKNRDIKGNDIVSQETLDYSDDDDESELPPEDTPNDDEDIKEEIVKETQESNSEVY